jgi:hypothetical protein
MIGYNVTGQNLSHTCRDQSWYLLAGLITGKSRPGAWELKWCIYLVVKWDEQHSNGLDNDVWARSTHTYNYFQRCRDISTSLPYPVWTPTSLRLQLQKTFQTISMNMYHRQTWCEGVDISFGILAWNDSLFKHSFAAPLETWKINILRTKTKMD